MRLRRRSSTATVLLTEHRGLFVLIVDGLASKKDGAAVADLQLCREEWRLNGKANQERMQGQFSSDPQYLDHDRRVDLVRGFQHRVHGARRHTVDGGNG